MRAVVDWPPRVANQEAHELADGICASFNPWHRKEVVPSPLTWDLLPEAIDVGRVAECTHQEVKTEGRPPNWCIQKKMRRPEKKLRVPHPW